MQEINLEFIGRYLKQKRSELGYTLKYVSEKIGITKKTLIDIEHEKRLPSLITLDKITALYGLTFFIDEI